MNKVKKITMLLKEHKRSSVILASCLALALVSGAIFISSNKSTFTGNIADMSDKKNTDKDKVNQDISDKDKPNDTGKELEEESSSSKNVKRNDNVQESKDKNVENEVINKTTTKKENSPTYDDNSKKEESKPTTPSPTPMPTTPEQQVPEPAPAPKPVCAIGENPNLPCDYIDLPAGYQVMDYETAKIEMAKADANGGGYDHGWLPRNDGQSVFVIRFW